MRLQLDHIRFKNFLAVGNYWVEIPLSAYKTTLVVGPNGAGKSSVLDAVSFALFNKPFRNINKPQLCNSITNKDCVVEIEFVANCYKFKIVRGIKPSVFEIWRDGELITQDSDNRDYQDAFEKYILKINHKTFCQIVVLGSAIFTPFMALPTLARRKVIEDLLDLEIFTEMNKLLKLELDGCEARIHDKKRSAGELEKVIELSESHERQMNKSKDTLKAAKLDKVSALEGEIQATIRAIETFQQTITTATKNLEKLPEHQKTQSETIELKSQLVKRLSKLSREIIFYESNSECPTCHQAIDDSFKTKTIETKKKTTNEVEEALTKIDTRISSIRTIIDSFSPVKIQAAEARESWVKDGIRKDNLESQRDDLQKEIKEIDNTIYNFDEFAKLVEMKDELTGIQTIISEMSEDRTVMGYAALLLKDSGIKGKIIKTFIPVINNLIQKYLGAFDFYVDFRLDETFEETILSRHRDNYSYESFSEGEKRRLDLAILFAWRAIARLRSSINCNLIIFDEVLDGSMDDDGLDYLLKIIETLTKDDNILIISHKDQMLDKFSNIMRFEKQQGFSRLAE